MKIDIKHRFTGNALFACDAENMREAAEKAVKDGANLEGEKLAIQPITISGLYWFVIISESYMRIGCQRHKHSEWKSFDDESISDMSSDALEFWKQNKSFLMAACKAHRAESLAYRKAHPEMGKEAA